jgi:predicted amidohydrolase
MIIFQPGKKRQIYSKKYLHEDELPFFVHGENATALLGGTNVALAICYELSVPQHAEDAFKSGATIYIASAVKTKAGVDKAMQRLSEIARNYSMTALLSNCIGVSGGDECDGRTAAWNKKGVLLGQLGEKEEGILIMDTETEEIIQKTFHEEIHYT